MWPFRRRITAVEIDAIDRKASTLPWADWWSEELARADERARRQSMARDLPRSRHVELTDVTMNRIDRVARCQGLTRHQLIEMGMEFYLDSWRKRP